MASFWPVGFYLVCVKVDFKQVGSLLFSFPLSYAEIVLGWPYLISMYYKRYELQRRFNIIFCGAVLAGAFSGVCESPHFRIDTRY